MQPKNAQNLLFISLIINSSLNLIVEMNLVILNCVTYHFTKKHGNSLPSRKNWKINKLQLRSDAKIWYSEGSRGGAMAAAGMYSTRRRNNYPRRPVCHDNAG